MRRWSAQRCCLAAQYIVGLRESSYHGAFILPGLLGLLSSRLGEGQAGGAGTVQHCFSAQSSSNPWQDNSDESKVVLAQEVWRREGAGLHQGVLIHLQLGQGPQGVRQVLAWGRPQHLPSPAPRKREARLALGVNLICVVGWKPWDNR